MLSIQDILPRLSLCKQPRADRFVSWRGKCSEYPGKRVHFKHVIAEGKFVVLHCF